MRIPAITILLSVAFCHTAHAAEPQVISLPDVDPIRFGWSGLYAGGSVGHAWLKDADHQFSPPLEDQGNDWIAGLHIGYLHDFSGLVVGVEVEATRLDIDYELLDFITVENAFVVKGRVGYAYDRFLFSGHAGGVFATTNYLGLKDWGYALGIGIDYAVTDNVIVGAQYSHFGFSEFDGTMIDATIDMATLRAGIRF